MTLEQIEQIIENQGIYEICYLDNNCYNTYYISRIEFVEKSNKQSIIAFCHTAQGGEDKTFEISKIVGAIPYWVGIITPNVVAPKDGIYIILCCEYGQGIDQYYKFRVLREGESLLIERQPNCEPIAYHFIPLYEDDWTEWMFYNKPYCNEYAENDVNVFIDPRTNKYYYMIGCFKVWDSSKGDFINVNKGGLFGVTCIGLEWDPHLKHLGHYKYNHFTDYLEHRWIKVLVEKRRNNEPEFLMD